MSDEPIIRNWDYGIKLRYYGMEDGISLEKLYQAFKQRMQDEADESGK